MGTEFKDLDTTPTLTLDPFQAADKKETPAVQQVEEPVLDDSILTEEERQTVEAFAKQIDLTNSSLILQYGAGTQKKMADFSESALDNVKSQDLGEVGDLQRLDNLIYIRLGFCVFRFHRINFVRRFLKNAEKAFFFFIFIKTFQLRHNAGKEIPHLAEILRLSRRWRSIRYSL